MLGLGSYGPWPLLHENFTDVRQPFKPEDGWKLRYVKQIEGWAHCFREPDRYLPPGQPRVLISHSDFIDPDDIQVRRLAKLWDVTYVNYGDWMQDCIKNWTLARRCLVRLSEAGLRVLVVGRIDCPDALSLPGIEAVPWGDQDEFHEYLARSRLLLVPGLYDPSPRIIPEALALDLPVLAYEGLLGGWKYITPQTGAFFNDEGDVVASALRILSMSLEPRTWFMTHFGVRRAEKELATFLRSLGPDPAGRFPECRATRVHPTFSLDELS
jgi:hypothetical protein